MDVNGVASRVAERLTPKLRDLAQQNGLPREMAGTLKLVWEDGTFHAVGHPSLTAHEYGDGKSRPRASVRKALTALEPSAQSEMTALLMRDALAAVTG